MNLNQEPSISVVMPVYNTEEYLAEAIESILNQTFKDFEFIIVDDNSTDTSWQIIKKYANEDNRIIAVKNRGEKGQGAARNVGLEMMKGKYYLIMDSDDISLPNRLEKQFEFMENNLGIDIAGSWMERFGTFTGVHKTPLFHSEIVDTLFFTCGFNNPTVIMRKAFLEKSFIRYRNETAEDHRLFAEVIKIAKFANIPVVLLLYRTHAKQLSTASRLGQLKNSALISLELVKKCGVSLSEKESTIYLKVLTWVFEPKSKKDLLLAVKIFRKISVAGVFNGYGEKFIEYVSIYLNSIVEKSIKIKITSLRLFFLSVIQRGVLKTNRSKVRYIYHYFRNLLSL